MARTRTHTLRYGTGRRWDEKDDLGLLGRYLQEALDRAGLPVEVEAGCAESEIGLTGCEDARDYDYCAHVPEATLIDALLEGEREYERAMGR